MEKFIKQSAIAAIIGLAILAIGDIPPDSLPLGAFAARLVGFKVLGILAFGFAVTLNKEWRVYGLED